jgi:hypothetical protein
MSRLASREPRRRVWLMQSRGLVSREGSRLPLSNVYEQIETTLPVTELTALSPTVVVALGRFINDPAQHRSTFLTTCVKAADLTAEREMLESLTAADRPRMLEDVPGLGRDHHTIPT